MTDEEEPMSNVEKVQKSLHDMFMGNKKSSVTFKDDGLGKLETTQENFRNMILNETNSMKNYGKNYSEIDKINSPNGNSKIERPTLSKSEIQPTIDEESDELKKTQGLIYELMMGRSASRRISRDKQNKIVFLIRSEIDRRKLPMERPVKLTDLESELRRLYGVPLNIFHSNDSYDYLQKINSQNELDNLIRLHDMRNPNSKFRLTVSPIDEEDRILKPDPSGVFRTTDFISDTTSDAATSANTILSSGDFNLAALANLPEIPERCPPEAYREGTKIGTGAHGSVYVCYDYETGEKLVVKKIFARGDANAIKQKMDSLRDSVGLLSRLSHENIVEYRGAVIADNFVLIFMEFMTGGSLYEVIREAGVLPPRQTIDTTRQILCGLEYLHNLGIVHRDIKSANIMRTAQMPVVVKIGDFGSAQFLRALASFSLTDYKGTPHYTAPEIFKRRKPYDEKADIYSVGITIIEMLTTRTPYADIEPAVLFYKIADDKNIEYDLPKETPKNLQNIIEKMLMNLNSLRQVLTNIYDELPHLPAALKVGESMPSVESLGHKFLQSLSSTDNGQDILFRYKLGLYQIHDLNQQSVRLANQTSTRMSTVQQDLNEHWEAVCHMHDRLAAISTVSKQLDELNRQISSFEKFLAQTEIAVLTLEAFDDKVKEEERRRKPPSLMDVS